MVGIEKEEDVSEAKFEDLITCVESLKELKVEEVNGLFTRFKKAWNKDNRFIKVTEYSTFLLHIDVMVKDLTNIKNVIKVSNENGLKKQDELLLTIENLKKELDLNAGLFSEQILKLSDNKDEIEALTNRLDVKTKLLDEKSIELAGEKKRHTSCLRRLDEKSVEIKKLKDELKEVNAHINNRITQGVRAKCTYDADALLKQSKEPVAPVKAVCNSSGVKIKPEIVIEARRLFASGIKKFEIEKILGLNKSTTIRICNDESYRAPKYYPDGIVPLNPNQTPTDKLQDAESVEEVVNEPIKLRGETSATVVVDECVFVEKVPSKAKQLLKKIPNRKRKK